MSIYDKKAFGFDFSYKGLKGPLTIIGALIVIAVVVMVALSVASFLQQKPLEISFEKNPLELGSGQTMLYVKVFNGSGASASNIRVSAETADKTIFISPLEPKEPLIATLGANESRQLVFMVNPLNDALEGSYTIIVKTAINGQEFTASSVLELKK